MAIKKVQRDLLGDVLTGEGQGLYRFEFVAPKLHWPRTEHDANTLSDWASKCLSETRDFLAKEAERFGVTLDEFAATWSWDFQCHGAREFKTDGAPAWITGQAFNSFSTAKFRRTDFEEREMRSRAWMQGMNDVEALSFFVHFLKKYDYKAVRTDALIIRWRTEHFKSIPFKDEQIAKAHFIDSHIKRRREKKMDAKSKKRRAKYKAKRESREKHAYAGMKGAQALREKIFKMTPEQKADYALMLKARAKKAAETRAKKIAEMTEAQLAAWKAKLSRAGKKGAKITNKSRNKGGKSTGSSRSRTRRK